MDAGELKVGDILLEKFNYRHATHWAIMAGQAIFSHNLSGGHANTVHAAIYTGVDDGRHLVAEAVGTGLQEVPISETYEVYRWKTALADLPLIAAEIAHTWVELADGNAGAYGQIEGFGGYSTFMASQSLLTTSTLGRSGRNRASATLYGTQKDFYCSMFVVAAYQAAAATMDSRADDEVFTASLKYRYNKEPIKVDLKYISPKKLQAALKTDKRWDYMGVVAAG